MLVTSQKYYTKPAIHASHHYFTGHLGYMYVSHVLKLFSHDTEKDKSDDNSLKQILKRFLSIPPKMSNSYT